MSILRPVRWVPLVLCALVPSGCSDDDSGAGPSGSHYAVVRFVLTPGTPAPARLAPAEFADVTVTFHSLEPVGDCTAVLYDADDGTYGSDSFVRFQIANNICFQVFEAGLSGYYFGGTVEAGLETSTDLQAGVTPFAAGAYTNTTDANDNGTFEFYVEQVVLPD